MSTTFDLLPTRQLPCVFQAGTGECGSDRESLSKFLRGSPDWLANQLKKSGAVLFRGFGIEDETHFSELVDTASDELLDYRGGNSPRSHIQKGVYNSTHAARFLALPVHCEVCYLERIPTRLFFMCKTPPGGGGQTPIADMADVIDTMDPAVVEAFERRGVMFVNALAPKKTMFGIKTWLEMFSTNDRVEAQSIAVERGYQVEWKAGDVMELRRRYPAFIKHPDHGRRIWFNQLQLSHDSWSWELQRTGNRWKAAVLHLMERRRKRLPFEKCLRQAAFGNGERIPDDMVTHVRETLWQNARLFDWQRGDVIVLDNLWIGHGRMPYQGERQIRIAMANPIDANKLRPKLADG